MRQTATHTKRKCVCAAWLRGLHTLMRLRHANHVVIDVMRAKSAKNTRRFQLPLNTWAHCCLERNEIIQCAFHVCVCVVCVWRVCRTDLSPISFPPKNRAILQRSKRPPLTSLPVDQVLRFQRVPLSLSEDCALSVSLLLYQFLFFSLSVCIAAQAAARPVPAVCVSVCACVCVCVWCKVDSQLKANKPRFSAFADYFLFSK